MVSKVALVKCDSYEEKRLKASVKRGLGLIGGVSSYIKPGMRVLLKPNLLSASPPEKAVTTHPAFLKSVIEIVKEEGAIPFVGESPGGINSSRAIEKILKATGIKDVCESTQTDVIIFDSEVVDIKVPEGGLFSTFRVGKAILDADFIINLPKLKTHGLMKMTGAVKNFFGTVPGLLKAQFHLKVSERYDFAQMLIDLYLAVTTKKPHLTIADGVVAMEGSGPSAGDPYNLGVILVSTDSVALDIVAARIMGYQPFDVYTNKVAYDRGITTGEVEVVGDSFDEAKPADFKKIIDTSDRFPSLLIKRAKNLATAKPYLAYKDRCTACGTCAKNCPVATIIIKDGKPYFDYDRCIRCYCCHELCPEQALDLKIGFIARLFNK